MSLNLLKPIYPHNPIRSLEGLAKAMRMDACKIESIAKRAGNLYRQVNLKPGSTRQVFDAKSELKLLHNKIKQEILSKVIYPDYLTGSLKGRDYKINAELHVGQAVIICEDVKGFFDSVTEERVYDIWLNFFGFSPEVSSILSRICTKNGALPQGGIPSSYLANLALWRDEPLLQAKLNAKGIIYSRYVDDIAMSSKMVLSKEDKSNLIAGVYGMLAKNGLSAKRQKHEIIPATRRMIATKLVVNKKVSLSNARRANARVAVFQLEQLAASGASTQEVLERVMNLAPAMVKPQVKSSDATQALPNRRQR